ncbi:MAG: AMIN domain-containing protein [Gammaproteobacteria bacterium]|nr:AMIN domain-containing protein [Gammaproteobacteria bacterium]
MLIKKAIAFLFLFLFSLPIVAKSSLVDGVRIWSAPDHSRLVFDVDGPIKYNTFRLGKPERLVIDFKNAKLRGKLAKPADNDLFIEDLRFAKRNKSDFRVVLDLKNKSKPKTFVLEPSQQYKYRLVIDLEGIGTPAGANKAAKAVSTKKQSV